MIVLQYRNKCCRGEITIFLSLILSVVIGLICVLIESARLQLIKMDIEAVMDMALHSCFGEYDQKLFSQYDLLFVDSSYRGANAPGINNVVDHLTEYIEANIHLDGNNISGEWYREELTDVNEQSYILASDEDGKVFGIQACDYITKYSEMKYVNQLETYKGIKDIENSWDFIGEWDKTLMEVDEYGYNITNPSKIVRSMVVSTDEFLNECELNSISYSDIPSLRVLNSGLYEAKLVKGVYSEEAFIEYMMQKLGCCTEFGEVQVLTGELEYVIYGDKADKYNIGRAIDEMLAIREKYNLSCIKSCNELVNAANEYAMRVIGDDLLIIIEPSYVEKVRESIIYAWAYCESAIEVSRLLNGGRCIVYKSSSDIKLQVENILGYRESMNESGGMGISYKEFLGLLLYRTDDSVRRRRCMDIIESNIRHYYNEEFRIDGCVSYLKAEAVFNSGYGYGHNIIRDYIYE